MSQGISFSGLGSGIDTDSIISQLVDVERRPIRLIQNQQTKLEQEKTVVQSINSSLLTLMDSVEALEEDDLFSIVNARSAASERVGVSATNEAAAGTLSVEVLALAQARSLSSRSFNGLSTELGLSGEFVVNGEGIEIATDDTLLDIRDKINSAHAGVSAQILSVAANDSRLILTADEVGEQGFDLKDASSTNILQALGFTASETNVKNAFANGARSAQFLAADQNIGSLLNLGSPPAGTITVGDQEIEIDLATDSLNDIRDKINAAAPTDVSAAVTSSDAGGLTRYRLEVEGTANFIDDNGIFEAVGIFDNGSIADEIVSGAESDSFNSTSSAVGSLLGLGSAPAGSVTIGGQTVAIDLAVDSLTAIQTKINAAAPAGVNVTIINEANGEGNNLFRLRIDGTAEFSDSGNVLEALGILEGSNNSFESVAQVLTGNVGNQKKGALVHPVDGGAKTDVLSSEIEAVGLLIGSSASGSVAIGDKTVSIDLAFDTLSDIRDKINAAAPTGVIASINTLDPEGFELQIDGTTQLVDSGGVLKALGVLEAPTVMNAETRFADILGGGVQAGDTITINGTNHNGDQVAGSFTISNTNLKIQSLLNAIGQTFANKVSASVDGAGRIVLRDNQSGGSKLDLRLQANNEGGGDLGFGTLTETTTGSDARSSELQAGQNALFRINGIALVRSSNTVTDAVQGVTLDLKDAEAGKLVNITITRDDTTELRQNIESFVGDFNASMSIINEQFLYDPEAEKSGPLSGDATLIGIQSQLRSVLTSQIDGLSEEFNALVLIGISFDRKGQLTIDDERLTEALTENLDEVRQLFVARGTTTDNKIEYISSNSRTEAGNYAVEITQAAAQAELVGSVEFSGELEEDQKLTLTDKVTGQVARIELRAGSTLDEIVTTINRDLASDVAEVRRASIANTTDGTAAITAGATFAEIFGAGVQNGDTIRISGTTHSGSNVNGAFKITDAASDSVGSLLSRIRSTFNGAVSASVDTEGRIVVTDNQVGSSQLTVTLIEENEGGGTLNFGSIDVETEGRLGMEVSAVSRDNHLVLGHGGYGSRNGFSIAESVASLGLNSGEFAGRDAQGTINGEEADGFGRILTGKIGSENVDGLSLRVSMTPAELAAGGSERGNVNLVYGVARQLRDTLEGITDDFDGTLHNRQGSIDDTIANMDERITDMERRIEQYRTNLVSKFSAMEGLIATLQSQGNFLTSQLSGLSR